MGFFLNNLGFHVTDSTVFYKPERWDTFKLFCIRELHKCEWTGKEYTRNMQHQNSPDLKSPVLSHCPVNILCENCIKKK